MRAPTLLEFQNQYHHIADKMNLLNKLYTQQSSQKNLLHPSDDPILAKQIEFTQNYLDEIRTFKNNNILALNHTQLLESAAKASVNVVDEIKQLMISANNDTLSDSDRQLLAVQLEGKMKDLLNIANREDSNHHYLFSGIDTDQTPFALTNGQYAFQGSQQNSFVHIGPDVSTAYNQSGYLLFDHILDGNGSFKTTLDAGNQGTVSTSIGKVTDANSYVPDDYTITFVTNSLGKLAYQVTGASSGQILPAPPATLPNDAPEYQSNQPIEFNGVRLELRGQPVVGDKIEITPSTTDNAFNRLEAFIEQLKTPLQNDAAKTAQYHQSLSQTQATINELFQRLVNFESDVGQRLNSIQTQNEANEKLETEYEINFSLLNDPDPIKIQTEITQQTIFIQASQSAYMQIQSVLMNLLKLG